MFLAELSKYILLFAAAFIEGPIVSFAAGFLTRLGYFSFWPAYLSLVLRDIVSDSAFYYFGRFGNQKSFLAKYGKYFKISEKQVGSLKRIWENHGGKAMFFGKLAYGLSIPIVWSAGLVKIPLKKFWSYAISATLIQYTIFMFSGYYLGASYSFLTQYFKYIGLIITVTAVGILLGFYLFGRLASKYEKKLLKEE